MVFQITGNSLVCATCSDKWQWEHQNSINGLRWGVTQRGQHYGDVIMSMMASQIASLTIVYSSVYTGIDQRKHQSSTSMAFVRGIHRWPVNSPYKGPVTRKMFPFDDAIMSNVESVSRSWYHHGANLCCQSIRLWSWGITIGTIYCTWLDHSDNISYPWDSIVCTRCDVCTNPIQTGIRNVQSRLSRDISNWYLSSII